MEGKQEWPDGTRLRVRKIWAATVRTAPGVSKTCTVYPAGKHGKISKGEVRVKWDGNYYPSTAKVRMLEPIPAEELVT